MRPLILLLHFPQHVFRELLPQNRWLHTALPNELLVLKLCIATFEASQCPARASSPPTARARCFHESLYSPGSAPPGTGPSSVVSLPFTTFVSQKMCHRELQVFTVHSSFGANREIVALHWIVLSLQEWYHRSRVPLTSALPFDPCFPLRVRFLEECQAQHFPHFGCGALSLKSLVKPSRNLVGKFHWQGFEHLKNNHIPNDTSLFLPHLPRRAKRG